MEISLSRFIHLTALIASGGTLVTACTINNVDSGTGGTTSTTPSTGGAASSSSSTTGGQGTGGTSGLTTGGATGTSIAGGTSTAGASATGGGSSTTGGTGTSVAGSSSTGGGLSNGGNSNSGGQSATGGTGVNSSSSATGGKTGTGGSATGGASSSATGGKTGTGGTSSSATGGVPTGGGTTNGGSTGCVSGDPAVEGGGFDCTTLSYYDTSACADPTGEGGQLPYGANLCDEYSSERSGSVKVLTDCLKNLTEPTSGWCGAEHEAQAEACRTKMETSTCPSSSAQTTCAGIHAACSSIPTATCVADLSPLSDYNVGSVDTCMEGASVAGAFCGTLYHVCAGYGSAIMTVTDACNQIVQGCTGVTQATCESTIDLTATGYIPGFAFAQYVACIAGEMAFSSSCDEAFAACTGG